jgi:hypothetical protein
MVFLNIDFCAYPVIQIEDEKANVSHLPHL